VIDESANDSQRRAARETDSKPALYGSIDKWPAFLLAPNEYAMCGCGHHRTKHLFDGDIARGACSVKSCGCKGFVFPVRKRE
jgi:hypothetical protein